MTLIDQQRSDDVRLDRTQSILDADDGSNRWPDPQPLPDPLAAVMDFDPRLLPDVFRPWLCDISDRMQCPPDFPAVGAMVALASVIGRRIAIRPKRHDDWIEVCNLWGAVIGKPGIMKSPALAESMKPLRRLVADAQTEHREAGKGWALELENLKAQQDALKAELKKSYKGKIVEIGAVKGARGESDRILDEIRRLKESEEGDAPRERRYLTSDTTTEMLGQLLAENPSGLLVFRDELTGWLRSLDRESREADRAFYLEAWNGTGAFTFDRIGRGTIHIDAACVSILGGIQPGPLMDYVVSAGREGRGADGLLQRFQMAVFPNDSGGWRNVDRYPDSDAKNAAFKVFERLADPRAFDPFDPMPGVGMANNFSSPQMPIVSFSNSAQEIFDSWRTDLETKKLRAGEPEIIEAHLAKYRKLVPALALILHLADGGAGPIEDTSMLRAAAWAEYLETHARRIYGFAANSDLPAAHALIAHFHDLPDPFTPRSVYTNHWLRLDKEGTKNAIELLADHDWLRVEKVDTGGRPSLICWKNPRIVP